MAYRFKHSDLTVTDSLRRIARDQLNKALSAVDQPGDLHDGIHDARKKCKKLRGLIRLVRPAFPGFKTENAALRDAARRLAPLRERGAGIETIDRLLGQPPKGFDRDAAGEIREALLRRAGMVQMGSADEALDAFRADLCACRDRAAGWELEKTGFSALKGGLKKTYRRARNQMKAARKTHAPEDMHDWRKRVKYHWYHTRLLKPIRTGKMKHRARMASDLSDLLGDHHDLVDLRMLLRDGSLPREAGVALLESVEAEMRHLETTAFDLGQQLLADKPGKLVTRWRGWWKDW
jgi:CHAD domain-containing protein